MERRLFLTGLLGVAGAAGAAAVLPRQALAAMPMGPLAQPASVLPDLSAPADEAYAPDELGGADEFEELEEGVQLANHRWNHRRRRVRRWRRRCRTRWINGRRRYVCRREPYWAFIWFWL